MRISFGDKLSVVVVHDSCICGLLFCSMRFFSLQKRLHFTVPYDTMRIMTKCLNPLTAMSFLSEITRFRIS